MEENIIFKILVVGGVIGAIIAGVSGIVGIWIGSLLNEKNEISKELREKKRELYLAIVETTSFWRYGEQSGKSKDEIRKQYSQITNYLSLYGSPKIIDMFEGMAKAIENKEKVIIPLTPLINQIREELGNNALENKK